MNLSNLTWVYFEETRRYDHIEIPILGRIDQSEYVGGDHGVDSPFTVLNFAGSEITSHGMGLTGSGLAVGETRGETSLEDGFD